jgi:hypothetical protein
VGCLASTLATDLVLGRGTGVVEHFLQYQYVSNLRELASPHFLQSGSIYTRVGRPL